MRDTVISIANLKLPSTRRFGDWLLGAADLGFVGVFLITALALGGRHDGGQFIYALSVSLAALAVCIRSLLINRPLRLPVWPSVLATLAIAVPVLQIVPLAPSVLATVAPGHADLLPMWTADSPFGVWSTISLVPQETLEGIALLVAHALLFYAVVNRIEAEADTHRMLLMIGISSLVVAGIAIAQYIAPNGKLLWFYDHPFCRFNGGMQGPYTNRNHLAHFLAFGIAALVPLAVSSVVGDASTKRVSSNDRRLRGLGPPALVRSHQGLGMIGLLILMVTLLATMSRGGTASLAIGVLVGLLVRWFSGRFRLKEALACAAFGTVVLIGVSLFDYEKVTSRLDDLVSGEVAQLDKNNARRLIWNANAAAISANPWLGHGAGSHRYIYPAYADQPHNREFTHAESGYLQIGCENGMAGLSVLLLSVASCGWWVFSGLRAASTSQQFTLWSALSAGLTVSVVHSFVDFVWYVPSLCGLAITFAAIAYRQRQMQEMPGEKKPRPFCPPVLAVRDWHGSACVSGVAFAVSMTVIYLSGPALGSLSWDKFLRVSRSVSRLERSVSTGGLQANENHTGTIENGQLRALTYLKKVLAVDQGNARAHVRFADRCLLRFNREIESSRNPMSLDLVRDTVRTGGFGSVTQMRRWLRQAFGESTSQLVFAQQHARLAAAYCPLEARSYLLNAELAFFDSDDTPLDSWIAQALRLRPDDGNVRYEVGRSLHAAGRLDEALDQYRKSLHLPGTHRQRLIATLSPFMTAEIFLKSLEPDEAATEIAFQIYSRIGRPNDLEQIAAYAQEQAAQTQHDSPKEAARCWRRLSTMNREIERPEAAVDCAQQAYALLPHDFLIRQELGMSLHDVGRFDEAEPHLRWCLARRPDLRYLQRGLKQAVNSRLDEAREKRESEREASRLAALERFQAINADPPSIQATRDNEENVILK